MCVGGLTNLLTSTLSLTSSKQKQHKMCDTSFVGSQSSFPLQPHPYLPTPNCVTALQLHLWNYRFLRVKKNVWRGWHVWHHHNSVQMWECTCALTEINKQMLLTLTVQGNNLKWKQSVHTWILLWVSWQAVCWPPTDSKPWLQGRSKLQSYRVVGSPPHRLLSWYFVHKELHSVTKQRHIQYTYFNTQWIMLKEVV